MVNVEGCLGLALLLVLLLRSKAGERARQDLDRWDAVALASVALLVAAAFWRSAGYYFLSDDFVLLRHAREFNARAVFITGGGDGFFRPLGYALMAWTWPWAGEDPVRWHAVGFLLHALNSMLVFALARALGFSRFAGWLAAALFAIHATRPEAVVWIAGRFDLLATFFVLLALLSFMRRWLWLALIAMIAGMLSKETAYACPLLMALTLSGSWRKRAWTLSPFLAAAAGMFAYRWYLFGGIGGYATAAGKPLPLGIMQTLKALGLRLWAILFFPVNWSIPPGAALAVAMAIYLAALVWMAWRRVDRTQLVVALGFVLVAALPAIQQLLIGADLLKARHLYLPSVGFCLLVAAAVEQGRGKLRWGVAVAVLTFNLVALSHNLVAWESAARISKSACVAAVEGLPRILNGVYLFQNGFSECVQMERRSKVVP